MDDDWGYPHDETETHKNVLLITTIKIHHHHGFKTMLGKSMKIRGSSHSGRLTLRGGDRAMSGAPIAEPSRGHERLLGSNDDL